MTAPVKTDLLPDPPETLSFGEITLRFSRVVPAEPSRGFVPYFHFRILAADGTDVGHINFRVGDTEHVRVCAGHIGFEIAEAFRGHGYALQACRAIAPLVRSIYETVTITCDPDNLASRSTIERLGAQFVDEIEVPVHDPNYQRGSRTKRRYRWTPVIWPGKALMHRSQCSTEISALRVRDFTPADLAACLAIFDSNVPEFFVPAEREAFASFLAALPGPYVVMDEAGEVVACGGYAIAPGTATADLCWGMVLRARQRSGLGRQLLLARLERIRADTAAQDVALNTSQHTRGFYERLGFVVERVQPGRYAPGLDRCDMRLHLPPAITLRNR